MYGHYIAKVDSSLGPGSVAGNLASIIAGRISYLLDLKGPSLLVDTACSSSLVAFHLACQAIRNGDCRMAVAGGVKLNLLPLTGFRIGIESEDYRTRSFDDSSDGTAWGEGVAAVLLKPLHLALQDRDSIYAVVKGSAVNQDGSSVGLTAPNALAQEAVIAKAWEDAGIDPESISYVEAHGTGTKLGDPVEINGLQRAFRRYTDKKQFCAIGSVKSNIGHLDSAAGIASIVKAVMALKHKELPASLHFQKPNRRIDFISSPVYVLHRRRPWTTDGFPRRCGISSFGFSGTNCHVILEEAPEIGKSSEGSGASYPVMLSAQSESALRTLIRRYVDFLGRHPDTNLADFSYTAAVGRGHYRYRLAAVAESARELRLKLETFTAGGSELHSMPHKQLFYGVRRTGYGDRTENGDLAQQEPVVRGNDNVGIDSHMLERMCRLYAHGEDVEWERVYEGQERYRISLPPYPFEKHACWFAPADELADDDVNCQDRSCDANPIGSVGFAAYEEPSSGLERQLADIWQNLLELERVGANDDFYELGGSSLDAMRLEVEVTKVIPGLQNMTIYSNLNHYPTVKQLAAFLRENP
jgi:acyl transferase domain-containing protein